MVSYINFMILSDILYILRHVGYLIIFFLFWEFFAPALDDGFLLESEWLQISSSLRVSS